MPFQITSAAESEAVTTQKLVKGHAYSVTGAEEVGVLPQGGKLQQDLCVVMRSHKRIFNTADS